MPDLNIKISDLRTRITFQAPTITQDTGGAQVGTYANIALIPSVWAQWINDHGQESIASEAVISAQRATVRFRYRSDVQTTWRVMKDAEPWQILSIDQVQDRNRYVELRVERVKGTV